MTTHLLATYKDGHKDIQYCRKCGAEGTELLCDCPIEKNDDAQADFFAKKVDRVKEQP